MLFRVILLWASRILAALVTIMTAIPLFRAEAWWIRAFDFPRLQVLLLGVLALVGLIVGRKYLDDAHAWHWVLTGLLVISIGYQSLRILPYTPVWSKQTKDADPRSVKDSISLVVANVLMTNRNADDIRRILKECDPDVALFMEVDEWWIEKLSFLEESHVYRVLKPQPNTYGIALYSKHELIGAEVAELLEEGIPSIHTTVKLQSGREIAVRCVHPKPPAPQEAKTSIKRDAELLIVGKEVKPIQIPVIVAGDLNDVAWSRTTTLFQKVSGLLDPRRGRGLYSTFDARNSFMRWPLDHIFHSKHFELLELERLDFFGSDHFPVYVRLALTPEAPLKQEEPHAAPDEKREAEEKIQEGQTSDE